MSDATFTVVEGADGVGGEIDFVVVTAVKVERDAVRKRLSPLAGDTKVLKVLAEDAVYFVGAIGEYICALVQCDAGAAGVDGSIAATSQAIRTWNPNAGVIMPGIAFGRFEPDEQKQKQVLCDVIVATQIIDYEMLRKGENEIARGAHPEPNLKLRNRLKNLDWRHESEQYGERSLQFGPMLSGDKLVDDIEFRDALFAEFGKAVGGEMEGRGVYAAASRAGVPWILFKSICDWGDGKKQKTWQPRAAANAADVLVHLLSEPGLRVAMETEAEAKASLLLVNQRVETTRRLDETRQASGSSLMALLAAHSDGAGKLAVPKNLQPMIEAATKSHQVALEQWLNSYNDGCAEYQSVLSERGKEVFRKTLGAEVVQLVSDAGAARRKLYAERDQYDAIFSVATELGWEE